MPRKVKGKAQRCTYCGRERSIKLFTKAPDICNFCFYFDKAAQLTDPYARKSKIINKA